MTNLAKQELNKVSVADLSHFNSEKEAYFIPKKQGIRLEVDSCYLVLIKDSYKSNTSVIVNWNLGSVPSYPYYKVEICKIMGKMIKVNGVAFDPETKTDIASVWSGWLFLDDIEIISKL